MQKAVSKAIHSRATEDALGEPETALAFDEYMKNLQMFRRRSKQNTLEVLQSSQKKPEPGKTKNSNRTRIWQKKVWIHR